MTFILAILRELAGLLLPELFREMRRPREILFFGGEKDLRDDVSGSIMRELGGAEDSYAK